MSSNSSLAGELERLKRQHDLGTEYVRHKLNSAMTQKIKSYIADGGSISGAAKYVKITPATLKLWLDQGEEDVRFSRNTLFSDLYYCCSETEAELERKLSSAWSKKALADGAQFSWKATKAFLERRFADSWVAKEDIPITNNIFTASDSLQEKQLDALTEEEIRDKLVVANAALAVIQTETKK